MYEKTIRIPQGGWKLSELFHELQEVAGEAAAQWRASGEDLKRLGLMWVVVRYEVSFARPLLPGEELRFQTWALPFRHKMSQRNVLLLDGNGDAALSAAGVWAVVDRETRKMIEPADYPLSFATEAGDVLLPRPGAPEKTGLTHSAVYTVQEADLDMNLHMNNTRYFDLAEGELPSADRERALQTVRAAFSSEARLGESIDLSWGEEGDVRFFSGRKNGEACFEVSLHYHSADRSAL